MHYVLTFLFLFVSLGAWSQGDGDYLELRGRRLTLRQDLTRGGAICFIGRGRSERNYVNISDEGRYIQQSYYAGRSVNRQADGQSDFWSP